MSNTPKIFWLLTVESDIRLKLVPANPSQERSAFTVFAHLWKWWSGEVRTRCSTMATC